MPETYPTIPEPSEDLPALAKAVRAMKSVVELLTGARHVASLRAVTSGELAEQFARPLTLPGYARVSLPPAATLKRGLVFVNDGAGVLRVVYSDGFSWRYLADGGVVADSTAGDGDANIAAGDASGGR